MESWSGGCASMPAAFHWAWFPPYGVAVEETVLNKFSNQDLPDPEFPVQRYLVLIQKHMLWKFETSVFIVFTFFDKNDFWEILRPSME